MERKELQKRFIDMKKTRNKIKEKIKKAFPRVSEEKLRKVANGLYIICEEHHKDTLSEICK